MLTGGGVPVLLLVVGAFGPNGVTAGKTATLRETISTVVVSDISLSVISRVATSVRVCVFTCIVLTAGGSGLVYFSKYDRCTHWEGVFNTEDEQQLTFKGRDMNKNGKFVVLRTYFTKSEALGWMNGLVCILSGV
jgi:hypothetical protein